jgi:hypothetical protein
MLTSLTYRTVAEATDIFKVTEKSQVAAGHFKRKKEEEKEYCQPISAFVL